MKKAIVFLSILFLVLAGILGSLVITKHQDMVQARTEAEYWANRWSDQRKETHEIIRSLGLEGKSIQLEGGNTVVYK